ncbi:MAG: HAD-IA family hydrolase [Pseudomonadota bacterium]
MAVNSQTIFTVVFDLDGTMVDTAGDLARALNRCLSRHDIPTIATEDVRPFVGRGARAMILSALEAYDIQHDDQTITELLKSFLAHYADELCIESAPYPGLLTLLNRLHADGLKLAVCTNKPEGLSKPLMKALALDGFFSAHFGGDSLPFRKPDPRHILACISEVGGHPSSAIMIGDSAPDIEAARAAKVPSVVMSHGYSVDPVETLGADYLCHHLDEVFPVIQKYLGLR